MKKYLLFYIVVIVAVLLPACSKNPNISETELSSPGPTQTPLFTVTPSLFQATPFSNPEMSFVTPIPTKRSGPFPTPYLKTSDILPTDKSKYYKPGTDPDKIIYLSFDDGPSAKNTLPLLDLLDSYGIKATFFLIGKNVENYPDIAREISRRGHAIGNHSYSHVYNNLYASPEGLMADVFKCDGILYDTLGPDGYNNKLFRFPGGSTSTHMADRNLIVGSLLSYGYMYYDWSVTDNSGDLPKNATKEFAYNMTVQTLGNQKKAIFLSHDSISSTVCMDALPAILDYMIAQGYGFDILH
ncbi:MAG: polysaccharide deacetylase [Clostridiales bacterium]|nr:polysaccharide deacetylase [Clostridiales bacterium]